MAEIIRKSNTELIAEKIFTQPVLQRLIAVWRLKNEKIIFTNGCFDILHRGHIDYLAKAANLGTKLIVGVNSDQSVKQLNKGRGRPIQDENSRAIIVAALHVVDAVIIFNENTPIELIKMVQPDFLVKGGDWKPEQIVGNEIVTANGGKVLSIDFLPGYSTTAIEGKIKNV
jgi:rfaE bifunctional protein nucleotidyltransferase chain/domain